MTSYVHELKTDHEPFAAVLSGEKTHEIRSAADRDFKVGDTLVLKETRYSADEMRRDGRPLEFTGRTVSRVVTHIQRGYSLPLGMIVMSLAASAPNPSDKQEAAIYHPALGGVANSANAANRALAQSAEQDRIDAEPTEAMLNAARDWSIKKYGQAIGSDAAIGCWKAMHAAKGASK